MFRLNHLFKQADAVQRYLAAPLTRSRLAYLAHRAEQGARSSTLRGIAALQGKVIHYLELGEQGKVARPDIEAVARRWISQDPEDLSETGQSVGAAHLPCTAARALRRRIATRGGAQPHAGRYRPASRSTDRARDEVRQDPRDPPWTAARAGRTGVCRSAHGLRRFAGTRGAVLRKPRRHAAGRKNREQGLRSIAAGRPEWVARTEHATNRACTICATPSPFTG